MDAGIIAVTLH